MKNGGEVILSPSNGICYSFNSGVKKLDIDNPLKVPDTGFRYGLNLEIDIESMLEKKEHKMVYF